jgi:hypothetical protein
VKIFKKSHWAISSMVLFYREPLGNVHFT